MKKILTLLAVVLVVTLFAGCSLLPTSTPAKVVTNPVEDLFNYDNVSYHPEQVMVRVNPNADLNSLMAKQGSTVLEVYEEIGWALVSVPAGQDVMSFINTLKGQKDILLAEPNMEYFVEKVPTATDYSKQWSHYNANAEAAWDISTGSANVIVAILDTGVDVEHPEFAGNTFIGAFNATDDGYPYDDVTDLGGHGTHVAGIAAANGMSGQIAGVVWDSPIMPVRVENKSGKIYTSYLAEGMIYVADYVTAHPEYRIVVNMSIGGRGYNVAFKDAIDYAFDAGVLLVTSAGNDDKRIPNSYPSAYNGVVSVAASTPHDTKASFSTVGSFNSVAAPGVLIWSTIPVAQGSYANMQGTSMAAPYVAGAAALMLSKYPEMTPLQMKNQMEQTARGNGFTEELGYGIIDVAAMLGEIKPIQYGRLHVNTNILPTTAGDWIGLGIVTVYDANGSMVAYGTTGEGGNHDFNAIKPGEYTVSVTYYDGFKDAYEILEGTATVTADAITELSLAFAVPTEIIRTNVYSEEINVPVSSGDGPMHEIPITIVSAGYYEFVTSMSETAYAYNCDTVLELLDVNGNLIVYEDNGSLDSFGMNLTPGDYTVVISEYEMDDDLIWKFDINVVEVLY